MSSLMKTRTPDSIADARIPSSALPVGKPSADQVISEGRMKTRSMSSACCLFVSPSKHHHVCCEKRVHRG